MMNRCHDVQLLIKVWRRHVSRTNVPHLHSNVHTIQRGQEDCGRSAGAQLLLEVSSSDVRQEVLRNRPEAIQLLPHTLLVHSNREGYRKRLHVLIRSRNGSSAHSRTQSGLRRRRVRSVIQMHEKELMHHAGFEEHHTHRNLHTFTRLENARRGGEGKECMSRNRRWTLNHVSHFALIPILDLEFALRQAVKHRFRGSQELRGDGDALLSKHRSASQILVNACLNVMIGSSIEGEGN